MSDGLFSTVELGATGHPGFRLHRVEVRNWGTFDKRVWALAPGGETMLLTGDIGSGKSTLVDAVTTLLLPANRIAYNKAAGAGAKERTLRSYVEGHFKSERIEATGTTRAIGLRNAGSFSVVLGVFVNEGFDETVSIAQVFNQQDRSGQPNRFFVTSTKPLSIETDFAEFGSDLGDLRKRLRSSGAEIHTTFPAYATTVRKHLGIRSEQAMDLFHQTVSMKSVGNLNDFVRDHMLEPVDASERVASVVGHFEDLTKAHAAVTRARDQLLALSPLIATTRRYDDALARQGDRERQRGAVPLFFAELRARLLTSETEDYLAELRSAEAEQAELTRRKTSATGDRDALVAERAVVGGNRIAELEQQASTARQQAESRRIRRDQLDTRLRDAGLDRVHDAPGFAALAAERDRLRADVEDDEKMLENRKRSADLREHELSQASSAVRGQLASLAERTNNLPESHIDLRAELCADLEIDTELLPFAGELIDVAEEHEAWRGAAERVLRGFALSMLVPDEHYPHVAAWVNEHRLVHRRGTGTPRGLRLVYERVPARRIATTQTSAGSDPALADLLTVREGPLVGYVRDELNRRADHRCASSLAQFRASRRAVTIEGQVRSGDRHEKDDRTRIDDPRTWVLGWANERKIAALTDQLVEQQNELMVVRAELDAIKSLRSALRTRRAALDALGDYTSWTDVDWQEAESRALAAEAERERLVAGSSRLAEIETSLEAVGTTLGEIDKHLGQLGARVATLTDRKAGAERLRSEDEATLARATQETVEEARASYPTLEVRLGAQLQRSDECERAASALKDVVQRELDQIAKELGGYASSITTEMTKFLNLWNELRSDMDASIEARGDFVALHERLSQDDLPRYEAEFKEQLNTNTIRELVGFSYWLSRQSEEIQKRVDRINEAMGAIDYSPGRYIRLEKERTPNKEIQDFRADLRNATNDVLETGDHYSEQRFRDVQRIIERFQGRDGHAENDKAWTRRVTDVRHWFTFSASERDRESDEEWEHYRDSDGKSGGQKEKLAYTILAASLAYQFGLEWGVHRSRDFRFAVIDEAFGRGSDASTRYALELFAKLGLQLLIVTPLQKVHVIEPYVRAIGFVDNPTGSYSRVQTLTIEEFRARRDGTS